MVERVAVKGKDTAISIYDVIDAETPERAASRLATRPLLVSAMQRYCAALALSQQASAEDPENMVPALFAERCVRYLKAAPSADWLGFEKLTSK